MKRRHEAIERMPPAPWTRRDLLTVGAVTGLGVTGLAPGAGLPRAHTLEAGGRRPSALDPTIVIDGTDVRALALRALDAAKAAGAEYVDVRLTRFLDQGVGAAGLWRGSPSGDFQEAEFRGVGVRVRVGGAWGFAASPYWSADEVVALAHEAAAEAKANARGGVRPGEWTPIPVAQGHWATPIRVDPFVLPIEEKIDWLQASDALAVCYRRGGSGGWGRASFTREERAVATSEGSYCTQTLYTTGGGFSYGRQGMSKTDREKQGIAAARGLERCAAGWELFTEADIPGQLPRLWEEADPRRHVPPPLKRGEIGRYDVVFDAGTMGGLLEKTLGVATQLDRALGYEANAGGVITLGADPLDQLSSDAEMAATSYLGPDPLAFLGKYQAASPLVTVTASRSLPRGVATVKWDDEGVVPEDFALVKDGVLVDYQTTRDLAPALAAWYQQQGKPVRSHGCAAAQDATAFTLQHMPNLVLEPGKEPLSFEELVADTKRGLAVLRANIWTDSQARTGEGYEPSGSPWLYEIVNGKLGARLEGLSFLFSSTSFWRNVMALGGPQSAVQYASQARKGEPAQSAPYSVRAVPAKVKDVDLVDPARKA